MTDIELAELGFDHEMVEYMEGRYVNAATLGRMAERIKDTLDARYVLCHVHDMILHCDVFPHSAKAFRMTRKLNMVVA